MDYQNNPDSHQPGQELFSPYKNKRSAGFATASLVLGILSLVTCCCIYSALPFGALAIIFALLSRGGEMTMDSRGMTGLGLGIYRVVFYDKVNLRYMNMMNDGRSNEFYYWSVVCYFYYYVYLYGQFRWWFRRIHAVHE